MINITYQAKNSNLDTLSGLTAGDGYFIVGDGTNWDVESGAAARASLELGTLATESSINNDNWVGKDLSIANGGTGASDATQAREHLDVYSKTEIDTMIGNIDAILDSILGV